MTTQTDLLSSILTLVTDPVKVKQNIETLQERMAQHAASMANIIKERTSAEQRIEAAEKKEKELAALSAEIDLKKVGLQEATVSMAKLEEALRAAQGEFKSKLNDYNSKVATHERNVADLAKKTAEFESYKQSQTVVMNTKMEEATKAHENAKDHEAQVAALSTKLKSKMDDKNIFKLSGSFCGTGSCYWIPFY